MTSENEITVLMNYTQNMSGYPREVECVLSVSNEERYAMLDGNKQSYEPNIIRQYVDSKILKASM
jgi:hypothetical protein